MTQKELLIGAHLSIQGGFFKAILRAEKIGATCLQIFTKSNRQWKAKPITEIDAEKFIKQQQSSPVKLVVAHASYLINLASATSNVAQKSVLALADELQRCAILKIPYLVLHPGSFNVGEKNDQLHKIAEQIDQAFILSKTKSVTLLLETMAGQGNIVGSTFEELATILKQIKHKKMIGVCIDTCHIFAAGYTFSTATEYKKLWQHFDKVIGLSKLKVFHVNDSKKECGSRVDRHEHIGAGMIPIKGFELLMQDSKFNKIPKILETPKKSKNEIKNQESDIQNLTTLRKYAKK